MELYVLDSGFRRVEVVDRYESLIWTERYTSWGDFTIKVHATAEYKDLLTVGMWVSINESYRVMTIETVETAIDTEGRAMLTASGRSLEALLDDRMARSTIGSLTTLPKWILTGTPANIARTIFKTVMVDGATSSGDILPNFVTGSMFAQDTLVETETVITMEIEQPTTVYTAIKQLCDAYGLGFRLYKNNVAVSPSLYFDIYSGNDRTTSQTVLAPVIFSPAMNNISGITTLNSIAAVKNVAYVLAPNSSRVVYAPGWSTANAIGFNRRVMVVKIDSDLPGGTELSNLMEIKGQEALAGQRQIQALDGEISQFTEYRYNEAYSVGDILEMRNEEGTAQTMRVTEQIFTSDSTGDKSYPTLSAETFITPGSWISWDFNAVWDTTLTYWQDA